MGAKQKIMVVEDHPIFRMGVCELINQEDSLEVCGWAETVTESMNLIEQVNPDLIVLDLTLKTGSGMELLDLLRKDNINIPVLVLSMHEESFHAERCLKAGAKGYVMKHEAEDRVIKAIKLLLKGQKYISPKLTEQFLDQFVHNRQIEKKGYQVERLSNRELEIFQLIGGDLHLLKLQID